VGGSITRPYALDVNHYVIRAYVLTMPPGIGPIRFRIVLPLPLGLFQENPILGDLP